MLTSWYTWGCLTTQGITCFTAISEQDMPTAGNGRAYSLMPVYLSVRASDWQLTVILPKVFINSTPLDLVGRWQGGIIESQSTLILKVLLNPRVYIPWLVQESEWKAREHYLFYNHPSSILSCGKCNVAYSACKTIILFHVLMCTSSLSTTAPPQRSAKYRAKGFIDKRDSIPLPLKSRRNHRQKVSNL